MPEHVPAADRPQVLGRSDARFAGPGTKTPIRLVTDSAADLDFQVLGERGVRVVRLDVRLGKIGPETTSKWSPEEFWQNCARYPELPETSAPSPGAFAEAFTELADDGAEGVVCVTLSSKLSATYQAAVLGASNVADRIEVRVVDSLFATVAEGIVVLDACAAAEAGGDLEAVAAAALSSGERIGLYGALASLDNLRKSGRLGSAQAVLGGLLDIKPVLEVKNGLLELESRPRTRSRSLEYLASKTRGGGELERLAVVHAAAGDVDTFVELVAASVPRDRISVDLLGPVIGAHVGQGTIAVAEKRTQPPST
jgi:DegV family protein with EDD domain